MSSKKKKEIEDEAKKEKEVVNEEADTQEVAETEPTVEEKLTAELAELKDRNLRLLAEYDNFRRRSQKEKEALYPSAVADTIKEMLPVMDNFKRALETSCDDEEYVKGIKMIYNGFSESLKSLGLEEFGEVGETFDPNKHNAVMHIEDDKYGANEVTQIFASGYKIGERILRYAMVQTAN